MTFALLLSILSTGLLAGVLHAFDPDHLVTISALSASSGERSTARSCAVAWALGHGTILLFAAVALLLVRVPVPAELPAGAERLVGVILLASGGSVLHALWHGAGVTSANPGLRQRAPFVVGMVHGLAGSAAVFALLPMGLLSPLAGLAFVALFSAGVLCGMLGFGFGFARLQGLLTQSRYGFSFLPRGGIAVLAVAMGGYWLVGA